MTSPLLATDVHTLPARLTATDMMRIFQIHKSRFFKLAKQGRFDRFELTPTIGRRAWSGVLVADYLQSSRLRIAHVGPVKEASQGVQGFSVKGRSR